MRRVHSERTRGTTQIAPHRTPLIRLQQALCTDAAVTGGFYFRRSGFFPPTRELQAIGSALPARTRRRLSEKPCRGPLRHSFSAFERSTNLPYRPGKIKRIFCHPRRGGAEVNGRAGGAARCLLQGSPAEPVIRSPFPDCEPSAAGRSRSDGGRERAQFSPEGNACRRKRS